MSHNPATPSTRPPSDGPYHAPAISALLLALGLPFAWTTVQAQTQTLAPIQVKPEERPSLTVPNTQEAKAVIEQTAGGVALVPDTTWRDTQAATIKDVLDYTPGVFAQPKWGEDWCKVTV